MNIEHFTSHKRVKSFLEILNQLSFKNIKTETKLLNLYAVQLFMSAVLWELFISYKWDLASNEFESNEKIRKYFGKFWKYKNSNKTI